MRIRLDERFHPFSHDPGVFCPIPCSPYAAQIFPTIIKIYDINRPIPSLIDEHVIPIKGPIEQFTVELDLERSAIRIWGRGEEGFLRCVLEYDSAAQKPALFFHKKTPACQWHNGERLFLGVHKKADWTLVKRRLNPAEIFPFWFKLGSIAPGTDAGLPSELELKLENARAAIEALNGEKAAGLLMDLFKAGFQGMLCPRSQDEEHQGLIPGKSPPKNGESPLRLLSQGACLIKRLFFQSQDSQASILPCLPPAFHCGRFANLPLGSCGNLDMEWSKKQIKKMIYRSAKQASVELHFQKGIKRCRIRKSKSDPGNFSSLPVRLECQAC